MRTHHIQWSSDGRAVAIFYSVGNSTTGNKVLMWRAGFKPWTRSILVDYDDIMNSIWSPDNKRLLFRVGGSGDFTLDLGALFCLDARSRRLRQIPGSVRSMKWASYRKVVYWTAYSIDYRGSSGRIMNKKPRIWYSPE